jgi:hypothetical protein
MLGWMAVFALIAVVGTVIALTDSAAVFPMVGLTFAVLFLLGLVTRFLRGRAW